MTLVRTLPRLPEAPLDPSPDEARSLLRRELLQPDYHREDLLERLLSWLGGLVDRALAAASGAPPLQTFVAMVLALALVLALVWLASRARRSAPGPRPPAVLTGERLGADELRSRAVASLEAGLPAPALLDAFRALAVRQVERGLLEDRPGATAHEVALVLATENPHLRVRVEESARLFDAVMYGDRPATAEQATAVLALDDEMAARR